MSFLRQRKNIQQNFLSERVGDVNRQYELSKIFKPVTYMQKDLKEGLISELQPIREGMKNLRRAITFPQFPSITAYDDDGEEEVDVLIGDIAEKFLRKFASASNTDKTFELRDKDGKFYMCNKEAKIKESNIIVGDTEYFGKIFTNGDYDNYAEIMQSTNALRRNNDESEFETKRSLYRKRYNIFGSHHNFTM